MRIGSSVAEVGPGAILGELALLRQGRRMATLRAVTPCRVAVVPKDRIDRQALEQIAKDAYPSPEAKPDTTRLAPAWLLEQAPGHVHVLARPGPAR
jgi:CRP-like cAMP-binding protein